MFACHICDPEREFATEHALFGHVGAAHARKRERKEIVHSTPAGYRAHNRRGERPCADCLRAWRQNNQRKLKE